MEKPRYVAPGEGGSVHKIVLGDISLRFYPEPAFEQYVIETIDSASLLSSFRRSLSLFDDAPFSPELIAMRTTLLQAFVDHVGPGKMVSIYGHLFPEVSADLYARGKLLPSNFRLNKPELQDGSILSPHILQEFNTCGIEVDSIRIQKELEDPLYSDATVLELTIRGITI